MHRMWSPVTLINVFDTHRLSKLCPRPRSAVVLYSDSPRLPRTWSSLWMLTLL